MNKPKKDERRVQERAHVEMNIDLQTYDKYYLSKLENVSIGGAFVRTQEVHPVGTEVKLRFQLEDPSPPIEATGVVVWVYKQPETKGPNSSGLGIQFKEILTEDRSRIADFVAKNTKD